MKFNKKIWELGIKKWNQISKLIGFETRKDSFLQGFYVGYNQNKKLIDNMRKIILILDNKDQNGWTIELSKLLSDILDERIEL